MGSGFGESNKVRWSVFDGVRIIAATPEALMVEIDSAISTLEYTRATATLDSASSSAAADGGGYDERVADEAYKAGCAALAAGKIEEALGSLKVSLSKCPPEKTAAVTKLQSLISLTSQQIQNQRSKSKSNSNSNSK
ncbi:hypothetical protein HN51_042395 [Arachis hypogaea]|uniref:uncharacterized protein n=1 Tax=Arachis hypogaea TaxID=3818 RepID=UPI0034E6EE56|nr:uncharacterized protein DS421_16g563580 [Arachis hypogaea]